MAASQSFKEAGKFMSENSEEIKGIVNGIKGDSKEFNQVFDSVNSILEDVDTKASKTHNQEEHTIKLGRKAENNPRRESVKEFEFEHKKEIKEVKSEEDELGEALKEIEGSEERLHGDIEHLHECMDHTDDILAELNALIESVSQEGLDAEKLEQLSGWIDLAAGAIRLEVGGHKIIVDEVKFLSELNQEALVDMNEVESDLKGLEREDQEGEELAQETGNNNFAKQEHQDEEMVDKEESEFKQEEEEEGEILGELESELKELGKELGHAEEEMNNLENEIQVLRSTSQSMRRRMSGKISSEINSNFEEAEEELQQASNIINSLEGEYSNVKEMVGKEEKELRSL